MTIDRFTCPASKFDIVGPRFDAKASFNEAFTRVDGRGRMAIQTLTAGSNGLAAFVGELTYKGPLTDVRGNVKLAAQKSRVGTIFADRTRLNASYNLGIRNGRFGLSGDFAAESSALDPSMFAGHILLDIFGNFVVQGLNAGGGGIGISILCFLFVAFISALELLVAAIQAYVFAILTSLYINDAVNLH